MKDNTPTYVLKIWLTAVLAGTIGANILLGGFHDRIKDISFALSIGFLLSLGFSLPSFIIFVIIVSYLNGKSASNIHKKLTLSLISIFLTLLPFFVLLYIHYIDLHDFRLCIPYAVFIIAGIWFYKLELPAA